MRFRNFPTVKCPHCKTWICNTSQHIITQIIEKQDTITPKDLDADIIIRCPKCKDYIALKQEKIKSRSNDRQLKIEPSTNL